MRVKRQDNGGWIDKGPMEYGGRVRRGAMPVWKAATLYGLASSADSDSKTEAASSDAHAATTSPHAATSTDG